VDPWPKLSSCGLNQLSCLWVEIGGDYPARYRSNHRCSTNRKGTASAARPIVRGRITNRRARGAGPGARSTCCQFPLVHLAPATTSAIATPFFEWVLAIDRDHKKRYHIGVCRRLRKRVKTMSKPPSRFTHAPERNRASADHWSQSISRGPDGSVC
jgi:hypothetical protein